MDFEEALVYEFQTITALKDKVFPQNADEAIKPPLLIYISSDGERIMTLSGPTNMTELTCELHIIGETYEQLKSLTKVILNKVNSFFQKPIGQDGPKILSLIHTEPQEDVNENLNYYKSSFDIRVRF